MISPRIASKILMQSNIIFRLVRHIPYNTTNLSKVVTKLYKNAMTNPHDYEVNSTKSGSLTSFAFYFRQEVVQVEKYNKLLGYFSVRISKILSEFTSVVDFNPGWGYLGWVNSGWTIFNRIELFVLLEARSSHPKN
jgi:hypothetical protein